MRTEIIDLGYLLLHEKAAMNVSVRCPTKCVQLPQNVSVVRFLNIMCSTRTRRAKDGWYNCIHGHMNLAGEVN